jgi:retron-type reverse transcriptase
MDHGKLQHSLMGTPQGGIVSPLLFNIYMFPFDKYVFSEFIEPHLNNSHKTLQNPLHTNKMEGLRSKLTFAK